MTKHNGIVILKKDVHKTIEWMTKNYDKEIGAFGIGEIKNNEIVIEKLVFTKQTVNCVHVNILAEDWGEIVKELSVEELGKIIFYWHKHPNNCTSSSQGDEDETYDVLMDEKTDRQLMVFMVTSLDSGKMSYETRIEIRKPIRATIEGRVYTEEDKSYEELCKKIIDEKVKKEEPKKEITVYDYSNKFSSDYGKRYPQSKEGYQIFSNNGMFTVIVEEIMSFEVEDFIRKLKDKTSNLPIKNRMPDGRLKYYITPNKGQHKAIKLDLIKLEEDLAKTSMLFNGYSADLQLKDIHGWYND